ncbi:uncharacterized protein LOC129729044 [Wyeomyia smithii]|uniref:uncharacterized protein LOC129729044 n=1 Tax=Wyeomyia smithii TaxID=174621 RepID=UPI002467FDEB|nr:uncharacterized protein LOC129729044 [Wyeomyia smithii]
MRSLKTLDELTSALQGRGYAIKRSATYLRLIPKRVDSFEGKRHVNTVPVKLLRASNAHHKDHCGGRFCTATIRALEELSSILGPNEVGIISQDDKARVAVGLTAANKQSPILMHVEYRIKLPEHDWIVANKHKLIPSVYAGIEIKLNGLGRPEAVGYSGPTYVAIRSGKHSSSTAFSHALDFKRLLTLKAFDSILKIDGLVKPVLVFTVDGGPDENPRYRKVIQIAIHHFKEYNLDAMFVTNAPGRRAFNRVERRMAPLGTFRIGHTARSFWIPFRFTASNHGDQNWFAVHVRTSQYLLQIVKCTDRNCCPLVRSSIKQKNPNGFLPPPISLSQTCHALIGTSKDETQRFPSMFVLNSLQREKILPKIMLGFKTIPYDLYCPSVNGSLNERICTTCGLYFASVVMLREHKKIHKNTSTTTVRKVRPTKIVAKREQECLAVVEKTWSANGLKKRN